MVIQPFVQGKTGIDIFSLPAFPRAFGNRLADLNRTEVFPVLVYIR